MKKVLITGAAGFFGSHLCDRFIKEGFHVIVVNLTSNCLLIILLVILHVLCFSVVGYLIVY